MKKLHVNIKTIPHSVQRYRTVGDWWFDDEMATLEIRVSDMQNNDFESLVMLHEFVEAILCKKRGISEKEVTAFDQSFEAMRAQYPEIVGDDEPGSNQRAPYYDEHLVASVTEEMLAEELKVDQAEYSKAINAL